MAYTLGRGWIEMLRIDDVELDDVGGLRFNVWTSIVLFVAAAVYFVVSSRLRPGREEQVYRPGTGRRGRAHAGDRPAGGLRHRRVTVSAPQAAGAPGLTGGSLSLR